MSVDLSLIIADLENKIAAADSNTPLLNLLQMVTAAERLTGGKNVYDSAGLLPTGAQYEGTVAMTADGTIRVYSGESGGWDTLDSSTYTAPPPPNHFPGSTSGYSSGGYPGSNVIDKFPFSSDANAADVGDLTVSRQFPAGQSSSVSGYNSGGYSPYKDVIDKFSFASDGNATDVGNLVSTIGGATGNSSKTYGYVSLGISPLYPPPGVSNVIEKFPFAVDANSTDVGDAITARRGASGQNSSTYGYLSGGLPYINDIEKFPFATDANSADVGDMTTFRLSGAGQSAEDYGYNSGGQSPAIIDIIDKFPFATDANATDVGDLTAARGDGLAGQSSTASGYTAGGTTPAITNIIDKFPFSTDANATDVGDLTVGRRQVAGQQV